MLAYCRYSPKSRDEVEQTKLDSIDIQRAAITSWLNLRDMDPIAEGNWLVDPNVSAFSKRLGKRPAGTELLARVRAGEKNIIAWSLDRVFRDVQDGLDTLKKWDKNGVTLYLANGVILDVGTAVGYMVCTTLLSMATYEPMIASERVKQSHRTKMAGGFKVSSIAPYGTREVDGRWVESPEEMERIAWIMEEHGRGVSSRKIARSLDWSSVPCRGGKQWSHQTVGKIIKREKEKS